MNTYSRSQWQKLTREQRECLLVDKLIVLHRLDIQAGIFAYKMRDALRDLYDLAAPRGQS